MATKLYSMWTHGNVAVSEAGSTTAVRQGFGVTFTIPAGQRDWIHIPIPTPVFVGDARISLSKVFYLYNAANGAVLRNVHVYDGPTVRMGGGGQLDYEGDYSTEIAGLAQNWFEFHDPLTIYWGLSVSLNVESTRAESRFYVSTAGADFLVDA